MKYLVIIAVAASMLTGVVGCAQGAGNAPSSSTDLTTSPASSGERATTAEQTSSFYRIPVPRQQYRGGGVLECADKRSRCVHYIKTA
jgi:hypothetical protein